MFRGGDTLQWVVVCVCLGAGGIMRCGAAHAACSPMQALSNTTLLPPSPPIPPMAGANAMALSLAKGARVTLSRVDAFADGVAVKRVGAETFRMCRQLVDGVVLVDNAAISAAIKVGVLRVGGAGVRGSHKGGGGTAGRRMRGLCLRWCNGMGTGRGEGSLTPPRRSLDAATWVAAWVPQDVFNETRSILEPAGAVAVAGAKAWLKHHGLKVGGPRPCMHSPGVA